MPNDVVAKPPADPSTGGAAERPLEAAATPAQGPPGDSSVPPGPPDELAAQQPQTPSGGMNRARGKMALKIPDDAVPSRPQSPSVRPTGDGEVSPLLGMRIISLGDGPAPSGPGPAAPRAEARAEKRSEPPRPAANSHPPAGLPSALEAARAVPQPGRGRISSIPAPPPPRPPAPAILSTMPASTAAPSPGVQPPPGAGASGAARGQSAAPAAGPPPGANSAASGKAAPGHSPAGGALSGHTAPGGHATPGGSGGVQAAPGGSGGVQAAAPGGQTPQGGPAGGHAGGFARPSGGSSSVPPPGNQPAAKPAAASAPPAASNSTPPRPASSPFLVEPLFEAGATPKMPSPRPHMPTRPWEGLTPLPTEGRAPSPTEGRTPSPTEGRTPSPTGGRAPSPGEGRAPAAVEGRAPAAAPAPAAKEGWASAAGEREPFSTDPDEAPLAARDGPEPPGAREPLPSFSIDDEETDENDALTTQPISSLPPPPESEVPDIEVEVSLDEPPPSVAAPPESGPDSIGRLSADTEADLAAALASGAYEPPPDDRPTAEPQGEPEPESVEVSPESVEVDEAPEVMAGEANDDDPFAEPEGEGEAAFGEPESVEAVEDLDATQEMAALDVGTEDEPVEADEDELEEVDDAEVQSDPRGSAARGPAAPYASSVRLSGPGRGAASTPPTPPARSSRDEALDLRTNKRRARPWWEELFDDDFLRATPRPTDAQVAAEASFIEGRLGLAKGALILDLACGHGRHAIELTRRGYQVVGFDLSLAMLAYAADEAEVARQKVNFLHGDMREMPFEDKFDGIYCWGTSFGFFEEEKNFALLQRVHRALRPGGVFLLETINRDFITARQPSLVWYEGDGCLCMDEAQVDFITSRLKVKRTIMLDDGRTREVDYSVRIYGLHELGKMMHEAGFRVIEVSGRLATPGIFFGADSPQCIVLAERD